MGKRIFVGNLSFNTTQEGLQEAFSQYGEVLEVKVMTDRETGRSRGFGFVEMGSAEAAKAAIEQMNGQMLDGRSLRVNEAEQRPERSGGGGGGFGGRGGGGGRSGGGGRRDDRGGRGGGGGGRW